MLTKFHKSKLREMIAVLLPAYKFVFITNRGSVYLFRNLLAKPEKYDLLEFLLSVLSPLVAAYKHNTADYSLAFYLGMWRTVQRRKNLEILDRLYSEFSRYKAPEEYIEIEVCLANAAREVQLTLIPDHEVKTPIYVHLLQSKTLKLIITLLAVASLANAM